jgi:hypothetical protein
LVRRVLRSDRLDEAEQCFKLAIKAVQELDVREVGEKMLCAAHLHRTHTRIPQKHKVRHTRSLYHTTEGGYPFDLKCR